MKAAMPSKLRTMRRPNKLRDTDKETKGSNNIQKIKRACIVEAHESTRKRLGSTLPSDHEDHIAGKGDNSLQHYNLEHKFIPLHQAINNSGCESSSGQIMGEARKVASVERKRGRSGSTKRAKDSPFCSSDGHLSSQNVELEPKYR